MRADLFLLFILKMFTPKFGFSQSVVVPIHCADPANPAKSKTADIHAKLFCRQPLIVGIICRLSSSVCLRHGWVSFHRCAPFQISVVFYKEAKDK
ncbi:hypothetical protein F4801DRAFT_545894 [Xylaria longipes]|nr:hypothetical protein F4801DRAFT_545894 [Xylaria longipes]